MKESAIKYCTKSAAANDILIHLLSCDERFSQQLNLHVGLEQYARKIFDKSVTFEAWKNDMLIGLVAAYVNDHQTQAAFITNVSVSTAFQSRGIASVLLTNCINYAKDLNFRKITLSVSRDNEGAIKLYKKHRFKLIPEKGDKLMMVLWLDDKESKET